MLKYPLGHGKNVKITRESQQNSMICSLKLYNMCFLGVYKKHGFVLFFFKKKHVFGFSLIWFLFFGGVCKNTHNRSMATYMEGFSPLGTRQAAGFYFTTHGFV